VASLNDYLRSQQVQKDPDLENLLTSLGTYGKNVQVLETLGAEKPTAEGTPGLGTRLLRFIGAPGNLIRGGILEATGNPTPELARVSGTEQLKKLATGEIYTGFGQLPTLRSDRADNVIEKGVKLGAAFALDVATDPISYVGGAGLLSRTQASTLLTRTAGGLIPDIAAKPKGAKALSDLVERSPRKVREREIAELEPTTEQLQSITPPRDVTPQELLEQELGNYLAEGLQLGGRKEVIRRLENFTDTADEARALYDKLPDEVKGGVALTNLLGVPIQAAPGQIVRLTQGRGATGPVGELVNRLRFNAAASTPGQRVSNILGGEAGRVLGGAKRGLAERAKAGVEDILKVDAQKATELAASPRFLDYVAMRDALGKKVGKRNEIYGASVAVVTNALEKMKRFAEGTTERKDFEAAYRDAMIGRKGPEVYNEASEAARLGYEAGVSLRQRVTEMQLLAQEQGVPIGILGDPATTGRMWMPLILDDESAARYKALHGAGFSENEYAAEYGRNAFWVLTTGKFDPDDIMAPELAALAEGRDEILRAHGYPLDANNLDVIALDARIVNKILKDKAARTGKAQPQFIEDPTRMFQIYSNVLSNRIANVRFFNELQRFGVITKDIPMTRQVTESQRVALFLSTAAKLSPELEAYAKEIGESVDESLQKLMSPKGLKQVQQELAAGRAKVQQVLGMADNLLQQRTLELDNAEAALDALRPTQQQISSRLRELEGAVVQNANEVTARDRAARNARARARTAANNPTVRLIDELTDDFNAAVDPAEKQFYQELLSGALNDADVVARLQRAQDTQITRNLADAQLNAIRTQRNALRGQNVSEARKFLDDYEQGILRRNAALAQLDEAKTARSRIKAEYDSFVTNYGLEQVQAIDVFVDNLRVARLNLSRHIAETKAGIASLRTRNATNIEVINYRKSRNAELERLELVEKSAISVIEKLKNIAGRPTGKARASKEQRDKVVAYIDNLIQETKDLTDLEFQAVLMFRSREKLEQFGLAITQAAARGELNDLQVQQIIGDAVTTFGNVRSKLNRRLKVEGRENILSDREIKFLDKEYFRSFAAKEGVKEKPEPSAYARKAVEGGYQKVATYTRAAANVYADSSVAQLLEEMFKAEANPSEWQKFINESLDPLLMVWKQAVTLGRGPGYLATNVIGGLFNNYLGGVKMRHIKLAGSITADLKKELTKAESANPNLSFWENFDTAMQNINKKYSGVTVGGENLYTLIKEFVTYGGFFSTETGYAASIIARAGDKAPVQAIRGGAGYVPAFRATAETPTESAYRRTIDFATTNRYMATMTDWAQLSEIFLRLAPFLDGYEKYRNFGAAMDRMFLLQYNYADLSSAEQWIRRAVPFYTWSRNNVPLQLRAIALQPGKIQRALYANEEFQNQFGVSGDDSWINAVVPEFVTTSNGWVSSLNFVDNNIGFFLKLPFEDVNKLFYESGVPRGRELGNMLGPALKTPIEVLFGVNLQSGAPARPGGEEVPGWYNLFRAVTPPGTVTTGPEGETRANQVLARTMQNFFPFLGTAERALAGAAALVPGEQRNILFSQSQQNAGVSSLLNTIGLPALFGYGTTTLSPSAISGEIRRRTERQQYNIKDLAATGGVDTDWVRQQLREGKSPQEIAMLIRAGYGKVKSGELTTRTQETTQRYQDVLGQLGSP
jgi:hypothetical protein